MNRGQFMLSQVSKVGQSPQNQESTFKILVATDNHVGFKEDDPIRCEDSFKGLEEVLQTAKEEKVDFLLLGGDLFHETHPSQKCMFKMINMLGEYVLGGGEIEFSMPNYPANFQDSNLNIELPIFIIHGNHDYPSDEYGNLSVLDLLHATKYLNHFGKFSNLNQITVNPIIFQKGDTTIALYGVGYMKDKYFHKMLEDGNIKFVPPTDLGYENAISILVIHQSRYKGVRQGSSYKNCVHPEQFPKWIDLIIRGHEHEQIDEIEEMRSGPRVIQPGSTVPTSLIPSEATPRRAILFEINGQDANFQDIILIKSYRPVLYENIEMTSLFKQANINIHENPPSDEFSEQLLKQKINISIQEFLNALDENFPQCQWIKDIKPQIRFKVEHTGIDVFNFQGLENQLADMVANPGQIFKFWKRLAMNNHSKDFKDNPKLEENFLKTLKEKDDFDTIGNDTMKDIKELYEARVNQNDRIKYLPCSVFMNTVESVGQRNRTQQIEDILQNLQEKIIKNVTKVEQDKIIQINKQYKQQMNGLMAKISSNIEGRKRDSNQMGIQQPLNKIVYQSQMTQQLGEMMHTMAAKIKQNVNQLYALDFIQNNNKDNSEDTIVQDADAEYQKLMGKKNIGSDQKRVAIKGSEIIIENQQKEDENYDDYQVEEEDRFERVIQGNKQEEEQRKKKQNKVQGDTNALDALKTMMKQVNKNNNKKQQKYRQEEEEDEEDQDNEKNIWDSGKKYKDDFEDNTNSSKINRNKDIQGNKNDNRNKQHQVEIKSALKRANYAEMFHKNVDSQEDEIDQEDEEQSNFSDCELKFEPNQPTYSIAHISEFKKQSVTSNKLNQTANREQQKKSYNINSNNINQNRLQFPSNNAIQSTLMSSLIQNNITNPQNNKHNQNMNTINQSRQTTINNNNTSREQQQQQSQQQQQLQVSDRKSKVLIPLNKKKVDFTNESIPKSPEQTKQQQQIKDLFKKKINITNSKSNS